MRCPKCSNEVNKEDFVCIYCSARLKEENIERIKIFRRIDENWTNPVSKGWERLLLVFTNPSRAFWDITHYREKIGSIKIYFLTALLFGLLGVATISHLNVSGWMSNFSIFLFYISSFIMFFLFGLIYYAIFYTLSTILFSFGANQSINLSKQLKLRYGGRKDNQQGDKGEKTKTMLEAEGGYTSELPEYLTTESKKTSIMIYAYAPMLIALMISVLIVWIALPSPEVSIFLDPSAIRTIRNSVVWGIIDWIQIIILIGWVPILMSIALRDIANASTTRVYLSSLIVAVLISAVVYFSRPTLLFAYIAIL